jgi:hypothetical protein
MPAAEEQDRARALIAAYADLAGRWEQLCHRLSAELERSTRAQCESPEGERTDKRASGNRNDQAAEV